MGRWGNGCKLQKAGSKLSKWGGGANNYSHSFWCSKFGCFWRCIWRSLVTWSIANLYLNLFVKPKEGLFLIFPLPWLVIPFPFFRSNFLPRPMGIAFLIPYLVLLFVYRCYFCCCSFSFHCFCWKEGNYISI